MRFPHVIVSSCLLFTKFLCHIDTILYFLILKETAFKPIFVDNESKWFSKEGNVSIDARVHFDSRCTILSVYYILIFSINMVGGHMVTFCNVNFQWYEMNEVSILLFDSLCFHHIIIATMPFITFIIKHFEFY